MSRKHDATPTLAEQAVAAAEPTPAPATTEATPAPRKNAAGKLSAKGLPCLCGCGLATVTPTARFLSGHDAKLRKTILVDGAEIPEVVRPFFDNGETIGGMVLVEGKIEDRKKVGGWA